MLQGQEMTCQEVHHVRIIYHSRERKYRCNDFRHSVLNPISGTILARTNKAKQSLCIIAKSVRIEYIAIVRYPARRYLNDGEG